MTLKLHADIRNAQADAKETVIGTAPILKIYTGTAPTNLSDAATGTLLVTITLPSDWLTAASAGAKSKSGTWSDTAVATGTPGYYRILNSAGTTVYEQGEVGAGKEMVASPSTITSGNAVTITTYVYTMGGA